MSKQIVSRFVGLMLIALTMLTHKSYAKSILAQPSSITSLTSVPTLHTSNINSISLVISWNTINTAIGQVQYAIDTPTQTANDIRGVDTTSQSHFIAINGLTPESTYNFDFISDGVVDDNGGAHYQFTTGATLLPNTPDTAYGHVYMSDGSTPAAGSIVYLRVIDQDSNGSSGQSTELSALINANGEWGVNLSSVRISDLSDYFSYGAGDQISVTVMAEDNCTGETTINVGEHLPAPDIILNCAAADVGPANSDWPMVGRDAHNTSYIPTTGPRNPEVLWEFPITGTFASRPAVGPGGVIYIGSGGGDDRLYALSAAGEVLWTYPITAGVSNSAPAVDAGDTVYVGGMDGFLYAVDAADGALKWHRELGGAIYASPVIGPDGAIYIGADNGIFGAYWPSGEVKWEVQTHPIIQSSVGLSRDFAVAYVGTANGRVCAFNTTDGQELWCHAVGTVVRTGISVGADGTIFLGNSNYGNTFFAVNPDGSRKCSHYYGNQVVDSTPAIGPDGTVYTGHGFGKTLAYDPADCTLKWDSHVGGHALAAPLVDGAGTIYHMSNYATVYAKDPLDGANIWGGTRVASTSGRAAPTLSSAGILYVPTTNKLVALGDADVRPMAAFTAGPLTGTMPLTVTFTDRSTGAIANWQWDFGDGVTSTLQHPQHTYNNTGIYTITLTINGAGGANTITRSNYITVEKGGVTFSHVLVPGWNLTAIPLHPLNTAITQVLTSIAGSYDLVYAYDGCQASNPWQKYDPGAPLYANSLTALDETRGFWINMITTDTLVMTGTASTATGIPLCTGWNLGGYPALQSEPITTALGTIEGQYSMVYAHDALEKADPWQKYDPAAPPFANDLEEMSPGRGYWIKATTNTTWVVND